MSIFLRTKIHEVTRYGNEGYEIHRMPEGMAMTVNFEIEGQKFVALNGGPLFKINEAISKLEELNGINLFRFLQ